MISLIVDFILIASEEMFGLSLPTTPSNSLLSTVPQPSADPMISQLASAIRSADATSNGDCSRLLLQMLMDNSGTAATALAPPMLAPNLPLTGSISPIHDIQATSSVQPSLQSLLASFPSLPANSSLHVEALQPLPQQPTRHATETEMLESLLRPQLPQVSLASTYAAVTPISPPSLTLASSLGNIHEPTNARASLPQVGTGQQVFVVIFRIRQRLTCA